MYMVAAVQQWQPGTTQQLCSIWCSTALLEDIADLGPVHQAGSCKPEKLVMVFALSALGTSSPGIATA